MTDNSDRIKHLRELAKHRAKMLGKSAGEMEEWQAADALEAAQNEIVDLKVRLIRARNKSENARRDINRAMDKYLKDDQS